MTRVIKGGQFFPGGILTGTHGTMFRLCTDCAVFELGGRCSSKMNLLLTDFPVASQNDAARFFRAVQSGL